MSPEWKKNTEEEALLGVSLTGIMDHPILSGREPECELEKSLQELKEVAIETNKEWAERLGINPSAAITCVKPSGTVSQLVDCASGIHSRHNPYYIRTVRTDKKDPLYAFMRDQGVPVEDALGKEQSTAVFSFPMKAPQGSVFRNDMSAIKQLELWKVYAENWCEHKPSVTISVKEEEWTEVGNWVWKNFDSVSGISFLPYDGGIYRQAPYQDITEEEYLSLSESFPVIDWSQLRDYEQEDMTTGSQEYACTGNSCEIV